MTSQKAAQSPKRQLVRFIAKYTPDVRKVAQGALAKLRARIPGAVELVYDNYNALAIGFGPTERASDLVLSIVLYPRWVSLFFANGASLPDPQGVLKGSGTKVRHVVLDDPKTLDRPAVRALIACALEQSVKPVDSTRRRHAVIKSISAKRRSRRPGTTRA